MQQRTKRSWSQTPVVKSAKHSQTFIWTLLIFKYRQLIQLVLKQCKLPKTYRWQINMKKCPTVCDFTYVTFWKRHSCTVWSRSGHRGKGLTTRGGGMQEFSGGWWKCFVSWLCWWSHVFLYLPNLLGRTRNRHGWAVSLGWPLFFTFRTCFHVVNCSDPSPTCEVGKRK